MRIKLDENIPLRVQPLLEQLGHNVDTVPQEGKAGCSDEDIWQSAQDSSRFLITQDLDFSDIRRFTPGTHKVILVMRLHDGGRQALMNRLRQIFITESVESWKSCFVVISDRKIRVRYPKDK
jgi:predicted nuclease of predicted toxin-antitoxin system